jgi:2-keto-3-deoxy-L-arabinonate dehydratase
MPVIPRINGVVPVIPAAFDPNEALDLDSIRSAVEFVASRGLAGMCLPAYGSEFYKLSESERDQMIALACEVSAGRVPVIAQGNHASSRLAAELARRYESLGADVISFAVPRQFAVGSADLLSYCGRICEATSLPVLLQDFNPGGPTIDAEFVVALHRAHPNFRYVKLEDALSMPKIRQILERTDGAVNVLSGWGGYFLLETVPAGVCGIMPGVAICDLLARAFQLRQANEEPAAFELFARALPYIAFKLQNFELLLQMEKRLLVRRGIIRHAVARSLSYTPPPEIARHMDYLIEHTLRVLKHEGLQV